MERTFCRSLRRESLKDSVLAVLVLFLCACYGCAAGAAVSKTSGKAPGNGVSDKGSAQVQDGGTDRAGMKGAEKIAVAKVNGVTISLKSVLQMIDLMGSKQSDRGKLRKEALDRLIYQELAYQSAKAGNITIEQDLVEKAMAGFKANLGGEEEYRKFLEKENATEDEMREQAERALLLERIFSREVLEKTSVPEEELKKEYEKEKEALAKPERIIVTDVVFFLNNDKESLGKAEEVLKKIESDKDRNPWNLKLDGTFIVRDYEIKKEKDAELRAAALTLKEDGLSGIINTPDGFHIIKLKKYSPREEFTFEQVRGMLESKLKAQAQVKRARAWKEELWKNAKIEILDSGEAGKRN